MKRTLIALACALGLLLALAGTADASTLGDILKRIQQVANAAPPAPSAPPVTGGGGVIGPGHTHPPASQVGHIQFNMTGGKSCFIPIGPGELADRDFKLPVLGCRNNAILTAQVNNLRDIYPTAAPADISLGMKITLYDSATCGATAYPYYEIYLKGNAVIFGPTSLNRGFDNPWTDGLGAGNFPHGQMEAKASCIRVHRVNRLD